MRPTRAVSLFLTTSLLLVAAPTAASAAEGDVTVTTTLVTETDATTSVDITVEEEGGLTGSSGGTVDWAVVLDGDADATDVVVANGTVEISSSPLPFTSGTGSFSIDLLADDVFEDDETFSIELSNPSEELMLPEDTFEITITDDDGARLSIQDVAMGEGDRADPPKIFSLRVTLAEAVDHDTVVDYTTSDGSATEGEDYQPRPTGDRQEGDGTVTIAAGELFGVLDVRVLGDTEQEGDETVAITLSNARTDDEDHTPTIVDPLGIVTILEDDGGPTGGSNGGSDGDGDLGIDIGQDLTVDSTATTTLDARLTDAEATAVVTWDFDDGDTATGDEVEHAWDRSGTYEVEATVTDGDDTATDTITVTVVDDATVTRSAGETRVATAVRAALDHWDRADTALLATARNFPDALAAGPFAATEDAPLLLTEPAGLSPDVVTTLQSLQVRTVAILGGTAAISEDIANDLRARGFIVERIEGDDRFATAARLAREVGAPRLGNDGGPVAPAAVLANGRSFPDALGAGSFNALDNPLPVLLSETDVVPDITMETLQALGVEEVLLLGGEVALSSAVRDQLVAAGLDVTRLSGQDRYETSTLVAAAALSRFGDTQARPVFVTGQNFPDGLAAGAVAARIGGPVVLVPSDVLPPGTATFLRSFAEQLDDPVLLGGEVAISTTVQQQITTAINA